MTGQNDRQDRSLTGQVHDQAGHCPLTGRYLQPWLWLIMIDDDDDDDDDDDMVVIFWYT